MKPTARKKWPAAEKGDRCRTGLSLSGGASVPIRGAHCHLAVHARGRHAAAGAMAGCALPGSEFASYFHANQPKQLLKPRPPRSQFRQD